MRLVKGGKYMVIHEAIVTSIDSEQFLSLRISDANLKIPLTKDEPNEIKKVFNELITHLRKGLFKFKMEERKDGDLIYQVAKEYINQLNTDLEQVYQALKDYQLLEQSKNSDGKNEVKNA